jgi:hypothetical protein
LISSPAEGVLAVEWKNGFRVGLVVENAWAGLTELEHIAPCMLDATHKRIVGEEFRNNSRSRPDRSSPTSADDHLESEP